MLAIDAAAYRSPWRHRHPGDKAVLAFGLLGAAVALPPWPGAVIVGAVALGLLLGPARVPARQVWRSGRAPLGFAITGVLPLLVSVGGPGGFVTATPGGPRDAALVLARTVAAGLALLLFAFTTPLAEALPRLTRLGVPAPVVEVASLTYRMVFTLLDTAGQIRRAQAGRLGYASRRAALRSLAGIAGALFTQAFARAQRLQHGLTGRGYAGSLPVLADGARIDGRFVSLSAALVAAVVAVTLAVGA
ncbi:cobalt ECF transporter T component CbiQ [Bailinhaonella thermotolerans]|uniref:Cobalt ECF transporter T component CbiQ n=1 Tax=Bailinhaonella thermotolerans TaxID=1070861 RepID=A0A3A4AS13_9ACTN|nr:cobalt ECF transporter T component CbiQ [Bailinhaonella thermotolerans]RJL32668.1 cobalt ECF transporter T component CbiQ [Bailinhaonella thermotolerans]